jgi:toxin ParE1/3/4
MVKVIWTEFALGDLKSIHEYISKDSRTYADKFIDKIINRVDQLQGFPKSGRIVPEFDSETIRELIEGNYRIVYRINPDHIGIVRIHHSAKQLRAD